jgi:hypothetical protein
MLPGRSYVHLVFRGRVVGVVPLLFAALALALAAGPVRAAGPIHRVSYDPSDVVVDQLGSYSRVVIPGTETSGSPGAPALPVEYLSFVIPADRRVEDVTASWDEEELAGSYRVLPAQRNAPMGEEPEWTSPDPSLYASDSAYPAERVVYLGDGYLGGYRIANVAVHPLTYVPDTGKLTLARNISVELVLVPAADRSQPRGRMTARSDDLYRRLVRSFVANPEDVAGKLAGVDVVDGFGPEGFLPRYSPSLEGSPVEYVIVTNDEFAPLFQEYADWKTRKGVPAVVRTVSWIESNYPGGCDAAERIRLFLKDAFSSWGTTYALLGGDTEVVPYRQAWLEYYGGQFITCDLYFSDLDLNWNADGDSRFGEARITAEDPGDSVDLYPDIFVGRAPVATLFEVETFIDKSLVYETSPDVAFAGRDLFMGEVIFPYDWEPPDSVYMCGAEHACEVVMPDVPPEVHTSRLYQRDDVFPGSFPLDRTSALDSLNVGYNIVSHVAHGNKDILRVSRNNYIRLQDVDNLSNGQDKSGFVWMLNCTTAAIEFDCIGEHFMNDPDGGASSLFGPTSFCVPRRVRYYYFDWFDYFYLQGTTRAGVVCAMCKVPHVPMSVYNNDERWTQFSFLYLGDPEMRLWTDRPEPLTVLHDASITLGPADIAVTVSDPAAVDSALVCIMKDGEVYERGLTDPSGQLTLSVTPETTGAMTITVTAKDHLPYEDTIGVASTAGAHLSLRSVTVDDDSSGFSSGNGNGKAEAGETIELDIVVGNGGQGGATNVSAILTDGADPYVSIIDGSHSLGAIPPQTEVAFQDAFLVSVSADSPNEHDVPLQVVMDDASRATWQSDWVLRLFRPELRQVRNEVDDGVGGNGVPEVGETVVLTIDVHNEGNGDAGLVDGILRYPGPEVTITDSTDSWGDLPEGVTASGQSGFGFDVSAPLAGHFQLILTDEAGSEWSGWFDLARPGTVDTLSASVRATTIYLQWDPTDDPDLFGYNIYRTDHPAGTYQRANDAIVERVSYFEDAGLDEYTMYYYRVAAVDSSGNDGPWSEVIEVSTNPPAQIGWPLLGGETNYSSPAVADIDLDGDLEILVASGEILCWHHDGVEFIDGDGDPRTNGVFAIEGIDGYRSSISVGEMDGDPYPEIVCAPWGNYGTFEEPEHRVYAWNADDGTVLDGWPVTTAWFVWGTAALGDLDYDGLDEVVIPCADGNLYAWKSNGDELIDGDQNPATIGIFANLSWQYAYGSPVLADIDQDVEIEIVVPSRSDSLYVFNPDGTSVDGWPLWVGEHAMGSPCVADLDLDGNAEIIMAVNDSKMFVFSAGGDTLWTAVIDIGGDFPPSPAVADIAGDEQLEIIQPNEYGDIYVLSATGETLHLWQDALDFDTGSSVVVGDVDGDSSLDLVVASQSGKVYALTSTGELLDGWPIVTGASLFSTPSLADLDLDLDVEVIYASADNYVYVWDCEGVYAAGEGAPWPTFRYDFKRSGNAGYEPVTSVPEDGSIARTLALELNYPNPFNPATTLVYSVSADAGPIELSVYNVAGQLVRTLVSGDVEPGRHSAVWDGRDEGGARAGSGVYFVRLSAGESGRTRKIVLLK